MKIDSQQKIVFDNIIEMVESTVYGLFDMSYLPEMKIAVLMNSGARRML